MKTGKLIGVAAAGALAMMSSSAFAATMMANNSNKGSVLVFPRLIVFSAWDTLITIVNDSATDVQVKCYYRTSEPLPTPLSSKTDVSQIKHTMDFTLTLTRNQPVTWSVGTGLVLGGGRQIAQPFVPFPDGSTRQTGELKCFAVGTDANGNVRQINFNQLFGTAAVINAGGNAFEYNAWAFQALGGTAAQGQPVGTAGTLNLDGSLAGYDLCPNILVADFQPGGQPIPAAPPVFPGGPASTWISIAACNQDLTQRAQPYITKYTYTFWNQDEFSRTGTHECGDSYYEQYFGATANATPDATAVSTVPGGGIMAMPLAQFSSLGTPTAYMRIESVADPFVCAGAVHFGMLGVILHFNQ